MLALVLTSLAVLIYFVHHVARSIQATEVISVVGKQLQKMNMKANADRTYYALKNSPIGKPLPRMNFRHVVPREPPRKGRRHLDQPPPAAT